jgi:hypothetical protein
VRYQRLILEAGSNAVTLRFHPRLTVIAGLGRPERDQLLTEVLGSLGGGRGGAHMELVDDYGRRLALIRPANGGADRVLEVDSGDDVTDEFVGESGLPSMLDHLQLTKQEARRLCRLSAAELAVESQGDSLVTTLASLDQARLWAGAERLVNADRALARETPATGTDLEDAPLIEEIERRHAAFEKAQSQSEWVRHHGIFVGGASAIGALPAAFMNRIAALGFLMIAALTTVVSIIFRRRMERARTLEDEALARAGMQSYIGFQLQRVDRMLNGKKSLTRVAEAAEEHRLAQASWEGVAGDISPDWVLSHRQEIEAISSRLRERTGPWVPADGVPNLDPAELARWLAARFTALRKVGKTGESLPLILDDPLVGVEAGVKQWILELIGRSAGSPQVVYLTSDPEVAAWARMEAIAGNLAVIEPSPDTDEAMAQNDRQVVELAARRSS